MKYLVVFDGTSAYVIPKEQLAQEIKENEVEILGRFNNLYEASEFCDEQNEII